MNCQVIVFSVVPRSGALVLVELARNAVLSPYCRPPELEIGESVPGREKALARVLPESLFWDESENQLSEEPQVSRPAYLQGFERQACESRGWRSLPLVGVWMLTVCVSGRSV